MNKKLGLAVAGALVAISTSANAGITIPAGDWTVDLGGNVNAYYTHTTGGAVAKNVVSTGLLPSAIGIGAKTRQNDMDVAIQFSFFTGINANGADNLNGGRVGGNGGLGYNSLNIRQAFASFGDASWGTVKFGRDLGVFGSDAILSDMTLLGVGSGAGGANSSTLGRIGSGYLYADWVGQFQYATPNFNGFQAVVAARESLGDSSNNNLGVDGKITYDFAANDVTGRVWVGGIHQTTVATAVTGVAGQYAQQATTSGANLSVTTVSSGALFTVTSPVTAKAAVEHDAEAWEIGAKASYAGVDVVGYYYDGKNMDEAAGYFPTSTSANAYVDRDNSGGYVQATFKVPTLGTKLGASWGKSVIGKIAGETADQEREAWIVGAYHPLTKSVNLVAEYNHLETTSSANVQATAKTVSLGAILFF